MLLLLAQSPEPTLERDYLRTFTGSPQQLVCIIATDAEGRPYRGYVSCSGWWFKYADEDTTANGYALPFLTDARGAIVMNPHRDDDFFVCWATDYPEQKVLVDLSASNPVYRLKVRGAPRPSARSDR